MSSVCSEELQSLPQSEQYAAQFSILHGCRTRHPTRLFQSAVFKRKLNGIVTNPVCPAERFTAVTRLHANGTHRKLHAVVPLWVRFMGTHKPCRCLNKTICWQVSSKSMYQCTDYTARLSIKRKNVRPTLETG